MDADGFVIRIERKSRPNSRDDRSEETKEHTQQQGASTKEQAQKKNKGKGEGKGKTQGKNRGKGFSFLDQETTAEGSGRAGPEPDPPSNGNFGDLKFELGSFTLQEESSKLKWLGGMARGISDAKRWSMNAAGRGQH